MDSNQIVSAIIPARNEEDRVAQAVRSLADQSEIAQIIVVNDQSSDGTARVLAELAHEEPRLEVVEGAPLPEGWVGKNFAAWQGAQRAVGEWLLFTDADAVLLPGSTAKALEDATANGASMVSYSPAQEMKTWWERALIPFIFCRLAQLYSYGAVNDPESPAAAANGQYLFIRRNAYEQIGGHESVRGEVLEDVALARRAKAAGLRLYFAPGKGIARVRMYATFADMWEGWTKNLSPLVTWAGQSEFRELFVVIPWFALLLLALTLVWVPLGGVGLLLLSGRFAAYGAMLQRNRFPRSSVIYYPVGVALYVAALLDSNWHYARGKVAWKGREYPVDRPETDRDQVKQISEEQ